MLSSGRVKGVMALIIIILLVLPSLGTTGLSIWIDSGDDFKAGVFHQTRIADAKVSLEDQDSLHNWTMMSEGVPRASYDGYDVPQYKMVYDKADGVSVLFGDTHVWKYEIGNNSWTKLNYSMCNGAVSAYDSADNVIVLFNWYTMTFDPGTDEWSTMNRSPYMYFPVETGQSMAYDDISDRMVLYGVNHNETWTYDHKNDTWRRMNPSFYPNERTGFSMVFDQKMGECVLYGGRYFDFGAKRYTVFNDTWIYNLTKDNWTRRNPASSPPPLSDYTMVYDEKAKAVVVFGGVTSNPQGNFSLGETWLYDAAADIWTNRTPPASPQPRMVHAAAYDSRAGLTVLFGGENDTARFGDTWTYNSLENLWTVRIPLVLPRGRGGATMVSEDINGSVVMFGGNYWGSPDGYDWRQWWFSEAPNDLWFYNVKSDNWMNRRPPAGPPPLAGHALVYDKKHGVLILFGGQDRDNICCNETWSYDISDNHWTNMSPPGGPSGRWGHGMAYDSKSGLVVLFGGNDSVQDLADTWTYNYSSNSWTRKFPSIGPPAGGGQSMAYDERDGLAMLTSFVSNSLWSYDIIKNCWVNISVIPEGWGNWHMAYNDKNGTLILGSGLPGMEFYDPGKDIWTCGSWPEMGPDGAFGFAYDASSGAIVMTGGFAGQGAAPPRALQATWVYGVPTNSSEGFFDSRQFDAGGAAYFGSISWNASLPMGTGIEFQFRTAATQELLNSSAFTGPDGTNKSYYRTSGQALNKGHNGARWMQYRAHLTSASFKSSPVLSNVNISYNLLQEINITSPVEGDRWTGTNNITWTDYDRDNDSFAFDIYLVHGSQSAPLATNLPNGTNSWRWNTSAVPGGRYRIRVECRDNNSTIPLSVNATSGEFTVYHPCPNHPPRVTLLSPENNSVVNSTAVCLRWSAIDDDGDPLTFTIHFMDISTETDPVPTIDTAEHFTDLFNLTDGATYFWTVIPSDGKCNSSDVLAPTWYFTVRLPPVNIPVRFTSTPPTTALVGQEYIYNLTSIDEDSDIPLYSLVSAPTTMILDPNTGKLRWIPTATDIGNHTVTVQVADGRGSFDNQTFTITVTEIPKLPVFAPKCAITYPSNGTIVNGTIRIKGTAVNGSLPLSLIKIRIDNGTWSTALGLENWVFTLNTANLSKGSHRIEAKAFAANLSSDKASADFIVRNPGPSVNAQGNPWCLPAAIIIVFAGISLIFLLRKRIRGQG